MTRNEWAAIASRMQARWYMVEIPPTALDQYLADLADLPAEQVSTALDALARDGREFPPTSGQLRQRAGDLQADLPTWQQVWGWLYRAAETIGAYRETEAIEWLTDRHPLVGEFARRLPFKEFCHTSEPQVFHGQARRMWEALADQARRDAALLGLPEAGLRAVERANRESHELDAERALTEGTA